jgi:hypothetical protein
MTHTPNTRRWNWPGPGHGRDHDLALLAAGGETGWWDDNGVPAPWPEDFLDPDSGWRPAGGGAEPLTREPGEPLF